MRPSALSTGLAAALFALALWLRLQLLPAAPYGDEGLHYWIARHFTAVPDHVSDVDGMTWFHPGWIFWQRPAYYVALHPFALQGFDAFRVGHTLWSSLLPVVAFGLLRAHGSTRVAAAGAGLFAAAYPPFVAWGGLALMDEPMTVLLAAGLWALRTKRHLLAAALLVLAVWTKETALIGLSGVLAVSLLAGWVMGRNRLDPFQLDRPTATLLLATMLAPLPPIVSLTQGLDTIGAASAWQPRLLGEAWVHALLLPVVLAGLAFRRSRALSAFALGLGVTFLVLNGVLHRAIEAWYLVFPAFFAACAAIAALDSAVRSSSMHRAVPIAASVLVGALLAWTIASPATGLAERVQFETEARDRDFLEAIAALDLGPGRTVITVDVPHLYPIAEGAEYVYVDSAAVRAVAPSLGTERFAAVATVNGTFIIERPSGHPFNAALAAAYAGCLVLDNGAYRVYEAWRCGRPQFL